MNVDVGKINSGAPLRKNYIVSPDDLILITGSAGFIGSRVVESLLHWGFRNLRCLIRPSGDIAKIKSLGERQGDRARVEILTGNLLSKEDCAAATKDVALIYHLAAGRGEKSFPGAFVNSVVTTRNLLEASVTQQCLKRFVNIGSFSVYSNRHKFKRRLLDESCPTDEHIELRGEAYCFAKAKQDEIVIEYGKRFGTPFVIVRPGYVFGPGKNAITDRVGIDTFGIFLHLGGSNRVPLTYVENCAEAIVLAGLMPGIDREVINVVDDDLPSSRQFLRLYKKNVIRFKSLYVPHFMSYVFCYLWEKYFVWSEGQLPLVFNLRRWHAYIKKTRYSNEKLKKLVGWTPKIPMNEALGRYFESCRDGQKNA